MYYLFALFLVKECSCEVFALSKVILCKWKVLIILVAAGQYKCFHNGILLQVESCSMVVLGSL